jgi:hypothetical protein
MLAQRIPPAHTHRMNRAIRNLQIFVQQVAPNNTQEGTEMSSPLVSIPQGDIDNWAANVNAAVAALQTIVANGNLSAADESAMNTAIGNLDGVAGTSTPPAPPAGT